jgi:aminopeptidase-like protein
MTETGGRTEDPLGSLLRDLFPICRSVSGPGLRASLERIGEEIPLRLVEVPTGVQVLDWEVPDEWSIDEGYIEDLSGRRIVDFEDSNLHVVGHSTAIDAVLPLAELREHLHTLPDHPEWTPYRTSFPNRGWGFCLPHRVLEDMPDGEYRVRIDATLRPGSLTYGECFLPGESEDEVLISVHCSNPSLANDNLSGIAVAVGLARRIGQWDRRLSYRFLFLPGAVGAITWLHRNRSGLHRVRHGLVLACLGDGAPFTYKRSRRGDAEIDRAMAYVLRTRSDDARIRRFDPTGYDERQYCSPGFDLPVGCLMRSPPGTFPEHRTSADDLDFVSPGALEEAVELCTGVAEILEQDRRYVNTEPFGEPQLGRRGLYGKIGGTSATNYQLAILWVLSLSDGEHSLLDVAERAGLAFEDVRISADALAVAGLLTDAQPS